MTCHGGQPSAPDKHEAHEGLDDDPSQDPVRACGTGVGCHPDTATGSLDSIHYLLSGEVFTIGPGCCAEWSPFISSP